MTGQYKVVRIYQEYMSPLEELPNSECVCHVYTVGTGLWGRISHVAHLVYGRFKDVAFLNGNLHWSVSDFEDPQLRISCLDLETKRFSTFSSPLIKTALYVGPTILGDCLCLCDYSRADGIDIWLMKEYGVEESWTKLFFIGDARSFEAGYIHNNDVSHSIKNFKDVDILLTSVKDYLFYLKKDNTTVQKLEMFGPPTLW